MGIQAMPWDEVSLGRDEVSGGSIRNPLEMTLRVWWKEYERNTVDGSEIRWSPVEVGSLSHYLRRVLYIPGGCFGIRPINSI